MKTVTGSEKSLYTKGFGLHFMGFNSPRLHHNKAARNVLPGGFLLVITKLLAILLPFSLSVLVIFIPCRNYIFCITIQNCNENCNETATKKEPPMTEALFQRLE